MTVHDATLLTMRSQYGPADRIYHRVFSVLAARYAAAVIVPSVASRDEVARAYGIAPERLHVTPYGVSPRFRPSSQSARRSVLAGYGIRQPYILFVGAEPPRKNLSRLVEAHARLSRRQADLPVQLVLAGPPEPQDSAVTRLIARLSLHERVRRIGVITEEHLPALYSGALCLAYPSLAEGFGFPILEAMACGTPVVTSARSAMAEVAGDASILVDPTSVEAIADGLQRIIEDRGLARELSDRGLERARAFTWERTAEATERVYRLVHGRRDLGSG